MLGIDVDGARQLLWQLRMSSDQLRSAAVMVAGAEELAAITTGVVGPLNGAGGDLLAIGWSLDRAAAALLGHRLVLDRLDPAVEIRIVDLVAGIERSSAGPGSAKRSELSDVLCDELRSMLGDPVAVEWATALLLDGAAPDRVLALLAGGPDPLFGRVVDALASGRSPADAGLIPELFEDEYQAWHQRHGQLAAIRAEVDAIEADRHVRVDPAADVRREVLLAKIAEIERVHVEVRLRTLYGLSWFDGPGSLSRLDALGAAAAASPVNTASSVGRHLGAHIGELGTPEAALAAGYLASDPAAAASFFVELGPQRTGAFLTDFGFDQGRPRDLAGTPVEAGSLARSLSMAFGAASGFLPPGFASSTIGAESEDLDDTIYRVSPEWLFAYGDFDPAFLVEAAEASLLADEAKPGDGSILDVVFARPDSRALLLDRVADARLSVELIATMNDNATLDALIWPTRPIVDRSGMAIAAPLRVVLQSALDERAAAAVIGSAGSRRGVLDLDIANAVSRVLATHVETAIDLPIGHDYFAATANVFGSGSGYEIDAAAWHSLNRAVAAQLENESWDWQTAGRHGEFVGRIEGLEFDAFYYNAQAKDAAIANTEAWIGAMTGGVGLAATVVGLPVAGGASALAHLSGTVGATVSGWVLPGLAGTEYHTERFLASEIDQARHIDRVGEAVVLLPALRAGLVLAGGSTVTLSEPDDHGRQSAHLGTRDDLIVIAIDPTSSGWVGEIRSLAEIRGPGWIEVGDGLPLIEFLNTAGGAVFTDRYPVGHEDATGLIGDRYETAGS